MNSGRTGPLKIKRSKVKGGRSGLWENGGIVDSEEVAKGVSYAKERWDLVLSGERERCDEILLSLNLVTRIADVSPRLERKTESISPSGH